MTTTQPLASATQPLGSTLPGADQTATMHQTDTTDTAMPTLKVTRKRGAPDGISSNCKQLVGLCRDRSGSMSGAKLAELNTACIALQQALSDPINKDGFQMSVVDFNHEAELRCSATPVTALAMPEAICSGGTSFDAPLNAMAQEIEQFNARPNAEGWRYLRPHVLFLSDGHASVSRRAIKRLQKLTDITAIAYGADADRVTLARISTTGEVHTIGTNGGELRRFFAEVGQTMTAALTAQR